MLAGFHQQSKIELCRKLPSPLLLLSHVSPGSHLCFLMWCWGWNPLPHMLDKDPITQLHL